MGVLSFSHDDGNVLQYEGFDYLWNLSSDTIIGKIEKKNYANINAEWRSVYFTSN